MVLALETGFAGPATLSRRGEEVLAAGAPADGEGCGSLGVELGAGDGLLEEAAFAVAFAAGAAAAFVVGVGEGVADAFAFGGGGGAVAILAVEEIAALAVGGGTVTAAAGLATGAAPEALGAAAAVAVVLAGGHAGTEAETPASLKCCDGK